MRWAAIALSLCACDSALQLRATALADALRPDAPGMCPPTGPPQFQTALRQIALSCVQYTTSLDVPLATATCNNRFAIGPTDTQPATLVVSGPGTGYTTPRITPEGDEIWLRQGNPDALVGADTTATVTRTFTLPGITIPTTGPWTFSTPTRALPQRHLIYVDMSKTATLPKFHELVESSPSVLVDVPLPTLMNIDGLFDAIGAVSLTDDGLRLVFDANVPSTPGSAAVYYTQRQTIDAIFPAPMPLGVPPDARHPFLRGDCGRFYFDAVGAVFYLPEG